MSEAAKEKIYPLEVKIWPDPALMEKANEVKDFKKSILIPGRTALLSSQPLQVPLAEFAGMLKATMHAYKGIGLAATQVGVPLRVMVVRDLAKNEDIVLVNPHISSFSNPEKWKDEGCLSFPTVHFDTTRFMKCSMSFETVEGEKRNIEASNLLAVELQHEFDHLDGITLMKYVTGAMSRLQINNRLKKFKQNQKKLASQLREE